jgi:hypothetical protein
VTVMLLALAFNPIYPPQESRVVRNALRQVRRLQLARLSLCVCVCLYPSQNHGNCCGRQRLCKECRPAALLQGLQRPAVPVGGQSPPRARLQVPALRVPGGCGGGGGGQLCVQTRDRPLGSREDDHPGRRARGPDTTEDAGDDVPQGGLREQGGRVLQHGHSGGHDTVRAPLSPCAGKVHLLRPRADSLPSVSRSVTGSTSVQLVRTAGRTWYRALLALAKWKRCCRLPAREFFYARPALSWRRRSRLSSTLKKSSPWRQQAKTIADAACPCCAGNPTLNS